MIAAYCRNMGLVDAAFCAVWLNWQMQSKCDFLCRAIWQQKCTVNCVLYMYTFLMWCHLATEMYRELCAVHVHISYVVPFGNRNIPWIVCCTCTHFLCGAIWQQKCTVNCVLYMYTFPMWCHLATEMYRELCAVHVHISYVVPFGNRNVPW